MKKILVLNLFPTVYPPTTGGTLRYYHIYKELSRYYDITLLSQTGKKHGEMTCYSPSFREYKAPRDPLYGKIKRTLAPNGKAGYEHDLVISIKLSQYPTLYHKQFERLYKSSDMIIHESPYMLGYDKHLGLDRKPRIYNSHNHEYLLANQIWKDRHLRTYLSCVYDQEKKLAESADLVFATSENERSSFIDMYGLDPHKVKLAPNGIHPEEAIKNNTSSNPKPTALFIGAEYPPNIEAVHFILHQLADQCPGIEFQIAGGCCRPFRSTQKANVKLLGKVGHAKKLKLFASADLAINPMFKGAGVNIKTLEYLSAGLPLFSTSFGARGLNLIDMKHYVNAERMDFAERLNRYGRDGKILKKISTEGQKYINDRYSWHNIAKSMKKELDKMIAKKNTN